MYVGCLDVSVGVIFQLVVVTFLFAVVILMLDVVAFLLAVVICLSDVVTFQLVG